MVRIEEKSGNGFAEMIGVDEDFEKLLAESEAASKTPEPGEIVRGLVVKIVDDVAFIDLGAKSEAIIALTDLVDGPEAPPVEVGAQIEAYVISVTPELRLSRTLAHAQRSREELQIAYENGIPVQARITARNKGGYEVRIGEVRAFMPLSQIDIQRCENPEEHVGQSYRVRIVEFSENGRNVVVSRAALLREEAADRAQETRARLAPNAVFEGQVRRLTDFGAFVDIGGLDGLVHISELSWGHVNQPSDLVKVGDHVRVRVLKIERGERERIALSMKLPEDDPWKRVGERFVEGGTYEGTVQRLEEYGAFIELSAGLEGLLHVSELSWNRRVRHPRDMLSVGQKVQVQLLSIDLSRQRLALGMKQLSNDPWQQITGRYDVGTIVAGQVENVTQFGVFVTLEDGITGLIPLTETNTSKGSDLHKAFPGGQRVDCMVVAVDPERRRLTLSLKAIEEQTQRGEIEEYLKKQQAPPNADISKKTAGRGFGTFADLLRPKLPPRA